MMRHDVQWLTAAPLWDLALEDTSRRRLRQPALLRFAGEAFMDELPGLLETQEQEPTLETVVARPETWRDQGAGWAAAGDDSLDEPLKLFQPVHNRFYLVAAALVCRRPGLPKRKVDVAAGERVSMLVRRLTPAEDTADPPIEEAWVGDREKGRWQSVAEGEILPGEERLPLFTLTHEHEGQKRQLHAGLIPAGSREVYEGAPPSGPPESSPDVPGDPLSRLADPRKAAWSAGPQATLDTLAPPSPADLDADAARELLSFVFFDLAELLIDELPGLWQALRIASPAGLTPAEQVVYARLTTPLPWGGTWRQAVVAAGEGDAETELVPPVATVAQISNTAGFIDLEDVLFTALGDPDADDLEGAPGAVAPAALRAAAAGDEDGSFYQVRCLYERPRCAPFKPPVLSAPSRPFRLGSFFDPDAPIRPVTIRLPVDTSIGGLRKFPKAVSVLVSNQLRQQMEQIGNTSEEDFFNGDVEQKGPSWTLGMICSLSIPIITLCAFILLFIIVQLLNIVFWWIAFFKICLPIPVKSES